MGPGSTPAAKDPRPPRGSRLRLSQKSRPQHSPQYGGVNIQYRRDLGDAVHVGRQRRLLHEHDGYADTPIYQHYFDAQPAPTSCVSSHRPCPGGKPESSTSSSTRATTRARRTPDSRRLELRLSRGMRVAGPLASVTTTSDAAFPYTKLTTLDVNQRVDNFLGQTLLDVFKIATVHGRERTASAGSSWATSSRSARLPATATFTTFRRAIRCFQYIEAPGRGGRSRAAVGRSAALLPGQPGHPRPDGRSSCRKRRALLGRLTDLSSALTVTAGLRAGRFVFSAGRSPWSRCGPGWSRVEPLLLPPETPPAVRKSFSQSTDRGTAPKRRFPDLTRAPRVTFVTANIHDPSYNTW